MSSVPKPESTTRGCVGLAVAVGVLEVEQFGAVGDIGAAVARLDAGGDQQAVGEDRGLVGLAVAVGVFEDEDLVVGLLPRLDLGIDLRAGDPEPPRGVEIHLDRLGEQRVGGEQVDLEAVGHLERLPLDLGVGIGDRRRRRCPWATAGTSRIRAASRLASCSSWMNGFLIILEGFEGARSADFVSRSRTSDEVLLDFRPHLGPERVGGAEIDRTAEQILQVELQAHEAVEVGLALEGDKDIHVAPLPVVAPGHRAEHGERLDPILLA